MCPIFFEPVDPVNDAANKDDIKTNISDQKAHITNVLKPYWYERLKNGHITEATYQSIIEPLDNLSANFSALYDVVDANLTDV